MRILCIADIHGNKEAVLALKRYAEENSFKHVLILGDFPSHSSFRDKRRSLEDARFALDTLSNFEVLAIPGNCDMPEVLGLFEEYSVNLHDKVITFRDTSIAGFGGSSPTPFHTPFEMSEDVLYKKLDALLSGITTERVVLAVHNPPLGTRCDMRPDGEHVGSSAVRKAAEKFQPDLLLCSHIHESGGSVDLVGKTKVANIGPLANRRIGVVSLGDELELGLGFF